MALKQVFLKYKLPNIIYYSVVPHNIYPEIV